MIIKTDSKIPEEWVKGIEKKRNPISQSDWIKIDEFILKYYINDEFSRKDILQILGKDYPSLTFNIIRYRISKIKNRI